MARGIEIRVRNDGARVFRARFRKGGYDLRPEFEFEEDAIAWRAHAERDVREGREPSLPGDSQPAAPASVVAPTVSVLTVEEALDELILAMKNQDVLTNRGTPYKASVIDKYQSNVHLYAVPRIGGELVTDLTTPDMQWLANDIAAPKKNDGLRRGGPEAAKKTMVAVSVLYRGLVLAGVVDRNPCLGVVMPRNQKGERPVRFIDVHEVDRLVEAARVHDETMKADARQPMIEIARHTGMREGEVLALRWAVDSLDLKGQRIDVSPIGNLFSQAGI